MCGILGVVASAGAQVNARRLLASLAHRGPDANGDAAFVCDGKRVWLGHTRLSILDLSPAGAQPMTSRDGRWVVTFNGEIYGHEKLRQGLEGPWRGHSDTETLVEALSAWGVDRTLREIDGMFAFAALDRVEGLLYLARDPFGIKPLYWARGEPFVFASEVRTIREALGPLEVDERGLQTFMTLRYVPSPATLWRGVQRVPPGHVLRVRLATGDIGTARYVEPTRERFEGTLDEAAEQWKEVLGAAVRRQLLSDVPVGVLLSGGIDSAVVAAMAKEARGEPLPTFTVGFAGKVDACEIDDAADTAKTLGLPHAAVRVGPEQLWDALDPCVRAVEEPLGTTSILAMWHLVARARRDVTVVLTGQGSDEPWGGYRRYQGELLSRWLPSQAVGAVGFLAHAPGAPDWLVRGLRSLGERDRVGRFVQAYALFDAAEREHLIGTASPGSAAESIADWLGWLGKTARGDEMIRIDSRMQLADDLLLYGDKISMAVALEARVPMIDLAAVRFVESLPIDYRVRIGETKVAHKQMAAAYLPSHIVHRPKRGFQVPFGEWARGPWRARVEDLLLEPGSPHLDRVSRGAVERLWRDHVGGRRDRERQIFALVSLAQWWRQQGDGTRPAA